VVEAEKMLPESPKNHSAGAQVAKRHHIDVAEVDAAWEVVNEYRAVLTGRMRSNLQKLDRSGTGAGPYKLPRAIIAMNTFSGSELGPYTANLMIMVRACDTEDDRWAGKVQEALNDPIAALPPEASGYAAIVGYNDEISCTGWMHKVAMFDRAANSLHVLDQPGG
jgi:hypothetical protein